VGARERRAAGWRSDLVDASAAPAHPGEEIKQRRPVGVLLGRGRAQQEDSAARSRRISAVRGERIGTMGIRWWDPWAVRPKTGTRGA
jgi:hypothetical protein